MTATHSAPQASKRRYRPSARSRCTICQRADRSQIEASLALGLSAANVAKRFECSPDAVQRHRAGHMDPAHVAALLIARRPPGEIDLEKLQRVEADRILAEIVDHRVRLRAMRDLALSSGGIALVLSCEVQIRSALS